MRAVVLRGEGRAFTAGYDLEATGASLEAGWSQPYDAPRPEPRPGAWDPVRDYRSMGRNVERFMKIWDCPKPVLGAIHGWAVGGATDLVLCCDLLFMAEDAYIGYAPSRIYGTPTTMLWVYRLGLEHAKQFLLSGDAIDAETAHRIGLVSHVCPPEELDGGSRLMQGASSTFRPTSWPSTSCSSTRPSRIWDSGRRSCSARCSTA